MKWWKILVMSVTPTIRIASETFKNQDADSVGQDDLIGISLGYGADLLEWVVSPRNNLPPKAPAELQ